MVESIFKNKGKICPKCIYATKKFMESCYCTKYGITIGYSKTSCVSFKEAESEQVQRKENEKGRDYV